MKAGKRVLGLVAAGVGLYVVWPSLVEIFSAWPQLITLDAWWLLGMFVCEALSFALLWLMLELALHTNRTSLVATTQLSSNAFGRVMPGGGAAGAAFQYKLLVQEGLDRGSVAAGLAATQLISIAVLAAMPLLSLPAILGGATVNHELVLTAIVGIAAFALILAGTAVLFASDRAVAAVGRAAQWLRNRALRRREPLRVLPERLVAQRQTMIETLGHRWGLALTAAAGRSLLDFLALLCALSAAGTTARPGLVLLAYVAASLLGMIPITPGGLGFVEAGLTSTLVLAGVGAADAVLATLAYRLASYWLPLVAGAFAYGGYRVSFRTRLAQ
ncbi:MAG: YbhN family protein [Gaiellaceae bacterium]